MNLSPTHSSSGSELFDSLSITVKRIDRTTSDQRPPVILQFAGYMADYGRPYSINMFTFFKCLQLYIMSVRH